jgi:hypothetical protein
MIVTNQDSTGEGERDRCKEFNQQSDWIWISVFNKENDFSRCWHVKTISLNHQAICLIDTRGIF